MPDSAAASQGRQITLATDDVAPPNSIYLTQDDDLWIYCGSSIGGNLRVVARLLLPDGSMSINAWDFTMNGSRNQQVFQVPLYEGFLMGIHVYTSNVQPFRGQVYASINVLRGNVSDDVRPMRLAQGYITFRSRIYWPGGGSEDSLGGHGNFRSIAGTTPAAGADISETVVNLAMWRPQTFKFTLNTSATVANRTVVLLIDDGANTLYKISPAAVATAGTGFEFYYAAGASTGAPVGINQQALPIDLYLQQGWRIRTLTSNLQVGDQFTGVQYSVEEWLA